MLSTAVRRTNAMRMMAPRSAATRAVAMRGFVSPTRPAFGGAGHDDEHHDHPIWENLPFSKSGTFIMVFGLAFSAVGLVLFANHHQNKKHGFYNK